MGIVDELLRHWYIDLSIPVVAALIGWVTKLVAIRMMFEPVEFVGRRPYLGWQGIVPRRGGRMASIAVDTMLRDLISAREVVDRIDADQLLAVLDDTLRRTAGEVTREIMTEFQPGLWDAMPVPVRTMLVSRAQDQTPLLLRELLDAIKDDPETVIDLKGMVLNELVTNKALLNRIFRESGSKEFRFIARSGIYFGGAIGVLQMTLWILFHEPLIMPAFGLVVGWLTDWLALKLIFNPKRPVRILGVTVQGLFLKRRAEVARDYGALIADEIITPRRIVEAVVTGPFADRVFAMLLREVEEAIDRGAGRATPLVRVAVGTERYQLLKHAITTKIMARLPQSLAPAEDYLRETMNVRGLLIEKMQRLDEHQFERLIRPAFEEDEWILIAVGAALGFVMGELQALVLEHFAR